MICLSDLGVKLAGDLSCARGENSAALRELSGTPGLRRLNCVRRETGLRT